jgi:hypothetical protein
MDPAGQPAVQAGWRCGCTGMVIAALYLLLSTLAGLGLWWAY